MNFRGEKLSKLTPKQIKVLEVLEKGGSLELGDDNGAEWRVQLVHKDGVKVEEIKEVTWECLYNRSFIRKIPGQDRYILSKKGRQTLEVSRYPYFKKRNTLKS